MPIRVSIIIPCFNGARYIPGLAHSLQPVLATGHGEYEFIFVDDGSTDQSAELARKYLPTARLIQQQNRGLSAARNAGVQVAQGKYLQLLDVDDTIEPEKLEVQTAAAESAIADVVYSDWRLLTVDNSKLVRTEVFAPAEAPCEMVEALLSGWYVPPVGYLFRRSSYVELGGCDETIKVWEDFDLFLRFAVAGKSHVYEPGILSNYYRYLDVQSLARRDPRGSAIYRGGILNKTVTDLQLQGGLTTPRSNAAARALFGVLRTAGIPDDKWLRATTAKILELDPGFRPRGPMLYVAAANVLGIARAERLGIRVRKLKSTLSC
jgi:glycosyltransferase involved in cell wall biosynthesis